MSISSPACAQPKARSGPGTTDAHRSGRALLLQAARGQGRVRSRAALRGDGLCATRVAAQFEGDYKLNFHLAPPTTNKPDATTGERARSRYGPWMMPVFRVLAKLRRVRGTALDVFGKTAERKMERALIGEYETVIAEVLDRMTPWNYARRGRLGVDPRVHSRLRSREGPAPEGRESARGGAARSVAECCATAAKHRRSFISADRRSVRACSRHRGAHAAICR